MNRSKTEVDRVSVRTSEAVSANYDTQNVPQEVFASALQARPSTEQLWSSCGVLLKGARQPSMKRVQCLLEQLAPSTNPYALAKKAEDEGKDQWK